MGVKHQGRHVDANANVILNQLYKLTGLQTTFHYNVLALVDGIQPKVMQKLLGHANIRITLDIYASVLKDDLTESMNVIEAVM